MSYTLLRPPATTRTTILLCTIFFLIPLPSHSLTHVTVHQFRSHSTAKKDNWYRKLEAHRSFARNLPTLGFTLTEFRNHALWCNATPISNTERNCGKRRIFPDSSEAFFSLPPSRRASLLAICFLRKGLDMRWMVTSEIVLFSLPLVRWVMSGSDLRNIHHDPVRFHYSFQHFSPGFKQSKYTNFWQPAREIYVVQNNNHSKFSILFRWLTRGPCCQYSLVVRLRKFHHGNRHL